MLSMWHYLQKTCSALHSMPVSSLWYSFSSVSWEWWNHLSTIVCEIINEYLLIQGGIEVFGSDFGLVLFYLPWFYKLYLRISCYSENVSSLTNRIECKILYNINTSCVHYIRILYCMNRWLCNICLFLHSNFNFDYHVFGIPTFLSWPCVAIFVRKVK